MANPTWIQHGIQYNVSFYDSEFISLQQKPCKECSEVHEASWTTLFRLWQWHYHKVACAISCAIIFSRLAWVKSNRCLIYTICLYTNIYGTPKDDVIRLWNTSDLTRYFLYSCAGSMNFVVTVYFQWQYLNRTAPALLMTWALTLPHKYNLSTMLKVSEKVVWGC